mmetsp:Transcript_3300/g.13360  ORF Transcript_3300/g.13360 Transcript_3300/m.13360 type:complete len:84 (+) Transcript_3300:225-476(+)
MSKAQAMVKKMMRIEWLGQTAASICWIVSVFLYGITIAGDALQLAAALSWLVANVASIVQTEPEEKAPAPAGGDIEMASQQRH